MLPVLLTLALAPAQSSGVTQDVDIERLLPIPSVMRPIEREQVRAPSANPRCKRALPERIKGKLPYGPGEQLSFNTTLLGIRTGKIWMRTEPRELMDGMWTYPVRAVAKTESLFSVLGGLDGQMVSYLDVDVLRPIRMANKFEIDRIGKPHVVAREDAAFSRDGQTRARLAYTVGQNTRARPAKLESRAALFDPLSLVQAMRSLDLEPGQRFCFEVYHRRALWRVEVATDKVGLVSVPFGTRKAILVDARMRKVGAQDQSRDISVWIGTGPLRLPLKARTKDNLGSLEVALTNFRPGRRLLHE